MTPSPGRYRSFCLQNNNDRTMNPSCSFIAAEEEPKAGRIEEPLQVSPV
jgi:hypothetical protein